MNVLGVLCGTGADSKAIKQMLGHESAQMTLARYAGLHYDHLEDVLSGCAPLRIRNKSSGPRTFSHVPRVAGHAFAPRSCGTQTRAKVSRPPSLLTRYAEELRRV